MPISLHTDILYIHFFPSYLSYHGIWDVYGYLGGTFAQHGFTYYQPGIYFVIAFFQWIAQPLNVGFEAFVKPVADLMASYSAGYRGHWDLAEFLMKYPASDVLRFSFFMKLSYLVADGLCLAVILRVFPDPTQRLRAAILWLFHPVNIFSAYIFGQYRLWPALWIWCAIFCIRGGRRTAAFVMLGVCALFDDFPFLLLLPFVLIVGNSMKERVKFVLAFAVPLVLVLVPLALPDDWKWVGYSYASEVIQRTFFQSITRSFSTMLIASSMKLTLAAVYGALLWVFFSRRPIGPQALPPLFVYTGLAVLLTVYATTGTMIHYTQWVLPFFVILMVEREPWPRALTCLWVLLLFLFNLDTRETNLGLFAPLNASLTSLPSFHEWADSRGWHWGNIVALSRALFTAVSLVFVFQLWTKRIRPLLRQNKLVF